MATSKRPEKDKKLTREKLSSLYMSYVLEQGIAPLSIYKFCKLNKIEEEDFYNFYGSFDALEKGIWEQFFDHTMEVMSKSADYENFSAREKLLTYFFTFFEILTANRSYVLLTLSREKSPLKNLEQLSWLRRKVKDFAKELAEEENAQRPAASLNKSETIFSESVWLQQLFLLRFWKNDNSARFESTDVAIEKSVNTLFDLFDTTPLERVFDFGKFLWKENMS